MSEGVVLGIDPGRSKVGLAVVRSDGQVLHRAVLAIDEFGQELESLCQRFRPQCIVVGGGTGFRALEALLRNLSSDVPVHVVNEAYTSEEARRRYLQENPPKGWRKLIPSWLRAPEQPYDDYVAIILAERYWREANRHEVQP
ncbi:MAG: resolvase [Armatimonadota bacterium]|nr:MAG: resolvase [Armatimonadota bacterium]